MPDDCRYTQSDDGKRLYVHLYAYPFKTLCLPGLGNKADYVQFLHDGSELKFSSASVEHYTAGAENVKESDALRIQLPPVKPDVIVPVIEIILK